MKPTLLTLLVVAVLGAAVMAWRTDALDLALTASPAPAPPAVQPSLASGGTHASLGSPAPGATPQPSIKDGIATFDRTTTLTAVAGAVVLGKGVHQTGGQVTFPVPCAIQLKGTSGFRLEDVHVSSKTLNIADTAFGAADNLFQTEHTTWTGSPDAGLLVQLSDPKDRIHLGWTSLTYPLGIAIQARGDRTEPDSGGTVNLQRAKLSSRGAASEGVTVVASTSKGSIVGDHSEFDAEQVGVVADRCRLLLDRKQVDCSATTLDDDLVKQAEAAAAEQAAAQR
jgi:hypothetical protein